MQGVDYAFPPGPSITGLVNAGIQFACRYGGAGSSSKHLDPNEAKALSAAGIAIVANVEGSEAELLGGAPVGERWARLADQHFRNCGMPPDRPIYLSVDFDVTSAQWPKVAAALRGASVVIGKSRVGVYGGRRAIEWARRDGVAQWFWQTYAWSGGQWVPGNHIEQYHNGVKLAGADVDLNRALATDFGQWTTNEGMIEMTTAEELARLPWTYRNADAVAEFVKTHPGQQYPDMHAVVWEVLHRVQALEAPQPAPVEVDYAKLAAALRPIVAAESEAAVRKVLGEAAVSKAATA